MNSGNDSNEFPPGEGAPLAGEGLETPLNTGRPAVAAAPGKLVFVLLFAAIFIFIIIRSIFFGEKPEVKETPHARFKETVAAENSKESQGELSISPGALPAPAPEIVTSNVAPPPPPPPPPAMIPPPSPDIHANAPTNEALSKRIHSTMLVTSGRVAPVPEAKNRAAVNASNDPNAAFAQSASESSSVNVTATRVKNLNSTIVQGKIIHAVLESAIDSDLPGSIRAITSHDVYAEAGKVILIPKGSRLVGTYNSQLRRGQARVFIIWQRVIRPDGVDVQIDSPAVDGLGRAGMDGDVDNKYYQIFSASIMTSALDIGVAAVGDALFGNQQTTTTNNGSGSTTTSSPTSSAMQQAVTSIGSVGQSIVNGALNQSPTINIDQGMAINVFVNRDLFFPADIAGNIGFVP